MLPLNLFLFVAVAGIGFGLGTYLERDRNRDMIDGSVAAFHLNEFAIWCALPTFEQLFGAREPITDQPARAPGEQEIMYYDGRTGMTRRFTYVGSPINCWKSSGGN